MYNMDVHAMSPLTNTHNRRIFKHTTAVQFQQNLRVIFRSQEIERILKIWSVFVEINLLATKSRFKNNIGLGTLGAHPYACGYQKIRYRYYHKNLNVDLEMRKKCNHKQ